MRILAIRGENLASLAEPFEIDFDAAPLAGAGLFAITGETGAGKSTLLDALCLALYDEFPRVKAQGANETIPDGEAGTLSANDARTILRRGAGRGFAEVDFIARDGATYRARCDLNRARGRAQGAMQQRRRALWRVLPDGAAEPHASGINEVKSAVEALTDLTCDQFRRTVLLAQGDFDAFLRADAKERAELLEKITGTQVYADISRRAYERWKQENAALDRLEQKRAGIGLLSPEEREARAGEAATLAERKAEESAAIRAVEADLRRHEAIAEATRRRDAAGETLRVAQSAVEALAAERVRLSRIDAVEPLRGAWERLAEAGGRLAKAGEAAHARRGAAEKAAAARGVAQTMADEAQAAYAATQAECARLAPVWEEAAALDRRIADAVTAEGARRDARENAASDAARATEALAGLTESIAAAERERAALDEAQARETGLAALPARFGELSESLDKREGFSRDIARLGDDRDAARKALALLAQRRAAFDEADAKDSEARAACEARIAEKSQALTILDEAGARARADALADADRLAAHLAGAAEKAAAAAALQAAALERREKAAADWRAAREAGATAQALLAALDARADEIARLADLAEATASEQAARLRAALVAGEPCPVCGATDHPHTQGPHDAFVAGIRERRAGIAREQEAARGDLVKAQAAEATAEREGKDAREAIERETARLAEAAESYAARRAAWAALPALDLPHPPEEWAGAKEPLAALASAIAAALSEARGRVSAAATLRADIDAERGRRDLAASAIEARRTERAALEAEERDAAKALHEADIRIPELADRRASIDREWAGMLAACGIGPDDLDRDPQRARRVLAARRDEQIARVARLDALLEKLAADREARAGAEAAATAAARTLAEREAALADAGEALALLRARRAGLLDGEATGAHRARREEARDSAHAAAEAARTALDAAAREAAVAEADARNAAEAETEAAQALSTAEAAFAAALAARGVERDDALALLALSPEEREALRARLARADEALREARSALGHCETALREAIGDGAPAQDAAALEALRAAHEERLARLDEDILANRLALQRDDEAREQAGALAREIAAAADVERLWAEMRDAIGSHDGAKFRTFAQSLTLEHLVALANRRLADLAPRYRLERAGGEGGDLGLRIVDRDLGDERRSTRSLSGGERFLTSLALALALCSLEGRGSFVDTLFIDEGFGTLDAGTLDVAIDALETLQAQGRKVGVISHVEAMHQRIPVQIRVERLGAGKSRVRVIGAGVAGGL